MAQEPIKSTGDGVEVLSAERGPLGWFLPRIEETYSRLAPRDAAPPPTPAAMPLGGEAFASNLQPGQGESVLAQVSPTVWRDRLAEYKQRKAAALLHPLPMALPPGAPALPGANNWRPLGPTVVLQGQTVGNQPVAGRIVGLAVAPGGNIVYAAAAAGGVFRSDDGGARWRSLMDGFDIDPMNFASASLACGAIAIDPNDPNRVYVGTGEGDTHSMFSHRIVNALPAYRGIGPIRTDDGGQTWHTELTADASPEVDLAGKAFFALAVDPQDRENVLAATTNGIYQRVAQTDGSFAWVRRSEGLYSSMVVARTGNTKRFFAAKWGVGVFHSTDGVAWRKTGKKFPTNNVGRIALGVQSNNPSRVYAFVADSDGALHGVYRLDTIGGEWKKIANVPDVLPGTQGSYDLTVAVDPQDSNLIYLGGDRIDVTPWSGSVWRCLIKADGTGYKVDKSASIGAHAHADVHVLVHTPGISEELWCGCDGGVFLNRAPRGTGQFGSRNDGLACLCSNFLCQHPTDPNILFTGLQDNGTAWTASGPIWSHVSGGDGGYCLVNWHDPKQVLVFANGTVLRSLTGGNSHFAWSSSWDFPWATMTQPIVSPQYDPDPAHAADASLVAVGAGVQVWVSTDFAESWSSHFQLPDEVGAIFALAFASTHRLFVGTSAGRVFRADFANNQWTVTRIDNVNAGPLGFSGLITDIAIDWSDNTLASIYVVFGGMGNFQHVWHFDSAQWAARSGAVGGNALLDIEHNALVVDPTAPENLYVGADIGVWHSPDSGQNWNPLQNGLPDAPVFDLQIHPTQRLLRAATYGRGIYEIRLN
ncbi:MAG: hypothetical protein DYG89_48615 [Caldilinea sp. CFX5]|nr:hypothetical protein [Caldilinea sp. CFX5]